MKVKLSLVLVMLATLLLMGLADSVSLLRAYQVTCGTTASRLAPSNGQSFSAFKFKNGASTIYLGGVDLTSANATTNGYSYASGEVESIDANPGVVYCVTTAGTSVLTILAGAK
jgi:hypothetical protein